MIYIVTHKKFMRIISDNLYKILHVGENNDSANDYLRDDTLINISSKNSQYCELTGLYWIWKNCSDDLVGIVHYRRYFVSFVGKILSKFKYTRKYVHPLKSKTLFRYLKRNDIILSKNRKNKMNVYDLYKFHHSSKDMDSLREVVLKIYPEYIEVFDEIMQSYKISTYNMMICRKEIFDEYCEWLFDILFELEDEKNIKYDDPYQNRVYGFLAERLLNVWVKYKKLKVKEVYTYNAETFGI